MKNLQHRSDARARVVHRNSDPVVIAQTLKVDCASKRKFISETRDKEGIESKRERERHTKRFKALDDWDIIKQENEYALVLMGLLLTDTAKPNAKGSTKKRGRGRKVMGSSATWGRVKPTPEKIRLIVKKNLRISEVGTNVICSATWVCD